MYQLVRYTAIFVITHEKGEFSMPVAYTTHNRILTVALSGDIDHHRVKGLLREVEGEIDQVLPRQLIVDCAGITFMDSSGIGLIMGRYRLMQLEGGTLVVTGASERLRKVMRLAGLDRLGILRETADSAQE